VLIGYWWESQKEGDHRKDQELGVWTISLDLREIRWDGVDWIDRARDRNQWRALVNTVLNLQVP
jgi:hypothetical protein